MQIRWILVCRICGNVKFDLMSEHPWMSLVTRTSGCASIMETKCTVQGIRTNASTYTFLITSCYCTYNLSHCPLNEANEHETLMIQTLIFLVKQETQSDVIAVLSNGRDWCNVTTNSFTLERTQQDIISLRIEVAGENLVKNTQFNLKCSPDLSGLAGKECFHISFPSRTEIGTPRGELWQCIEFVIYWKVTVFI